MPDLQKLQQDLKDTRQEVRNLTGMAMRPDLPPHKLAIVEDLLGSALVEVRLGVRHLREYLQSQSQPQG